MLTDCRQTKQVLRLRFGKRNQERFITVLDDATQTNGWEFLTELLDAYHPETTDAFLTVITII